MTATATQVADLPAERTMGPQVESGFWLPAWSLCVRELVRFIRQRTRIVGALDSRSFSGSSSAPAWAGRLSPPHGRRRG